jgi:uncharacterized protein
MERFEKTPRTSLKRLPERGSFDREVVYGILDEAFLCHVGFVVEGQPFVIPTAYGREGDTLYLHGSAASRMQRTLSAGVMVCVTVTLVDGLVLARSHFHHSVNYRSVVAFGLARIVADPVEKIGALARFVDAIIPGRAAESRPPDRNELAATHVLRFDIEDASAKVRSGGAKDDAADIHLPHWAGVVPQRTLYGAPEPDPSVAPGTATPASVLRLLAADTEPA